jgi:hypothetical protein
MRLPLVPLARGQCPRESRQRFVERLASSRAGDWSRRAKAGCSPVLKSDRLADHKGHGFSLGLADLLGGQGAAVATMQHFVSNLVHEGGKLLGWLHPSKQRDLPAMRKTLRGSNSLCTWF